MWNIKLILILVDKNVHAIYVTKTESGSSENNCSTQCIRHGHKSRNVSTTDISDQGKFFESTAVEIASIYTERHV